MGWGILPVTSANLGGIMSKLDEILLDMFAAGRFNEKGHKDLKGQYPKDDIIKAKQAIIALVRAGVPKKKEVQGYDHNCDMGFQCSGCAQDGENELIVDFHAYLDKLGGESG